MMHTRYIQFHPADDPKHLSKVGNWVITFLSSPDADKTQLAITNVIPRRILDHLQARRFVIENTNDSQTWCVQAIECFDSAINHTFELNLDSQQAEQFIQQLLLEFGRYDVEVTFEG